MPFIKSTYEYTKARRTFGRQIIFQDVPAHVLDSIPPNKKDQQDYMLRNPVNRDVQATLPQSSHDANTTVLVTHDEGIEHTEGGWPRDVHISNQESTSRYCRRVMHDESYINTVTNVVPTIKHYLNQNNAIDIYESYFNNMDIEDPVEKCSVRMANVFRDKYQRPVACVQWTYEQNPKLAVAYSFQKYPPETDNNISTNCYLWDVTSQTVPVNKIVPDFSCWQLACSPIDPEILICGLENGTVSVFDIRDGIKSVRNSSVFTSHHGPVTSLLYCHSRTSSEFFTGSPDGQCIWWDCRNLTKPVDSILMSIRKPLAALPTFSNSEGVSSLEFDSGLPTKFLCGTESGLILNVNKMGREHNDKLVSYWDAHNGPVRSVKRSPSTSRMFLSCGDSRVRVWSEEVRTAPILVTKPNQYEVVDAAWAPLRYSSYMSICTGGWFYFWDILRKTDEPVVSLQIAKNELTKMTSHSEGQSVAIGDVTGSVHLIILSDTMVEPGVRDKALMLQIYERQTKREHILDARIKEIRLKIKAEEETTAAAAEEPPAVAEESLDEDEVLHATEEEYFKIVNKELSNMEMLPQSRTTLL